jgi:hypothetical protein
MPFIDTGNEGLLNGTTPVGLVPSPSSGQRHNHFATSVTNNDSVAAVVTLRKVKAGTPSVLGVETLLPGETWEYSKAVILDATDESLDIVLAANHTSVAPSFDCAYAVIS